MKTSSDPRQTLDALLAGESLPFEAQVLERARALVRSPAEAQPAAVAELPEPLAMAVLEAAVRARAYALAEALSRSSAKAVAKAAKKALYRLRSLGVEIPERKSGPLATPAPPVEEAPASLLSAITGTGERALLLARPARGRVEVLQLVLSDEHGVVDLRVSELSRGTYRKVLKDATGAASPASMQISLDEAKAHLAEAARANLESRTPFPEGLDAALRHLGVTPAARASEVPPLEEGDAALAARAGALHEEPEIASWLPPTEEIRRLALKADEVATSNLYLDENQRAQQLSRTVHSLVDAFFTAPMRRLYGRRLWRMGELYQRLGRTTVAQLAKAEARRLFHGEPGTPSAFGLRLFEKVLAFGAAPRARAAAAPEPRPETERRSPGGLILP